MEVNINVQCEFVATEAGARVWNAQYDGLVFSKEYAPIPKKAGDIVKTQLWVVMEVFGPFIRIGMTETFFKGNMITIRDRL